MRRMVLGCLLTTAGLAFGANLVLVGDSTLAPRDETSPIGSWGEALAPYLKDDVKIIDTAVGGRTVRTTKEVWDKIIAKVSADDRVIIQFGINDANKRIPGRLVPEDEFKATLTSFVNDVRAKGAVPIVCSPISGAGFTTNSAPNAVFKMNPSRRVYGPYSRTVAENEKVEFIDMTELTGAKLAELGRDGSLALYVGPSEKNGKPDYDTVHPNKVGAKVFGKIFYDAACAQKSAVTALFKSAR